MTDRTAPDGSGRLPFARLMTAAVVVALLVGMALAARAEGLVYWADGTRNAIGRANLDGSSPQFTFIPGANDPCGIAVNSTHVFWGNAGNGTIGRANLNGTGVNQSFLAPGGEPCGVAVNGTHIFWTSGLTVGRANLNGTGADGAFIPNGGSSTCGVALQGNFIYWAGQSASRIGRALLNGTAVNHNFIGNAFIPCGVAVNATHIHWAAAGFPSIARAPITPLSQQNGFIDTETVSPCGVAVNGSHIYWTRGSAEGVGRANLDGTGVIQELVNVGAGGTGGTCGVALDGLSMPANNIGKPKVKANKKKGTAIVIVPVPGPGTLVLTGKGVKKVTKAVQGGKAKLLVKPTGALKRKLAKKGKAVPKIKLTFTPQGGVPASRTAKVKLLKR